MALEADTRRLARVPLLAALEPEALRLLAFSAELRRLAVGERLFRRGEPSEAAYFVLDGTLALDARDDGTAVALAGPDTLVGEMALLVETARPASASAQEPATVWRLSRGLFLRVLAEHPESAIRLRKTVAARLAGFARELDRLRTGSLAEPG